MYEMPEEGDCMKKTIAEVKEYRTTDLALAACLSLLLFPLECQHMAEDPRRVEFVFVDSVPLRKCANDFLSGKLQVPAMAYFQAIKVLKSRLYDFTERGVYESH
jgi:hypothetical protein